VSRDFLSPALPLQLEAHMFSDEEFRRVLFDASPDCILLLDKDGRVLSVNEACLRLMQAMSSTEVAGLVWLDRWPPAARENVSKALSAARGGATVRFEESCLATGEEKLWNVCVAPIRARQTGAIRLLCICRDVTDARRAERQSEESEAWLQVGCAVAGLTLARVDYKKDAVSLSAEAATLFGLGEVPVTVPRDVLHRLFHPDDAGAIMDAISHALDPSGPGWFEMDHRIIRPSGEMRWVRVRKQVVFDGEGGERRPSHATLAAFDVTKEKATDETLQKSEEFLRAILDSLPHHVAVIGSDGKIVAVNKPWERFARMQGGAYAHVAPGVDYLATARAAASDGDLYARGAIEGIYAVMSGRSEGFVLEYPCHAPDREQWFEMHVARLSGPPAALVLSHTDITDRRRNEQKRREAEERLRKSDRNKDEFIATLAHELRNPLSPLRSGLQFLRRAEPGDPRVARMQEIMERQVVHLVRLVDDLIDVSRISRGKLELKKELVDLADILKQAIGDVRALTEAKNLTVQVSGLDEALPAECDPVRVSQMFVNLLDNAIKYTDAGGTVGVAAERDGGQVCVAISDSGVGISSQMLPQIFDLFTQGEGSPKHGRAGLGIGLSLVRKLVELHGGSVEAQSDGEGRGARFLVRLPLSLGAPERESKGEAAPRMGGKGRRALLIDDNRDAVDTLAVALKSLGFEVDVAYSGAEGLARAAALRPGLVLLDLGMPIMDGYQTARALRAQPGGAEIEIVALTGWGEEETRRRVKEAGFDGHLIKPARIEDIAALFMK
jgi:PAS domain S-box-containing protein